VLPDLPPKSEANRSAFLDWVAAAYRRWRRTLAPYKGAGLVSYHDSWPYFEQAFELAECGIEEDRPGIPPSPMLIRTMKAQQCKVILHGQPRQLDRQRVRVGNGSGPARLRPHTLASLPRADRPSPESLSLFRPQMLGNGRARPIETAALRR
jgi:hypothetical protein